MRQVMAWLGTHRASRKNITKILDKWGRCAVIPGGIAEMFLSNDDKETCFFKSRKGTIKAAIQEGAHIVPTFFFGNTKLFKVVGGKGTDSFISRLSRKLRTSLIFFYGRFFLPIPKRHPLKMVTGDIIRVTKNPNPSDEDIEKVMSEVIAALEKLWERKPVWETRQLEIIWNKDYDVFSIFLYFPFEFGLIMKFPVFLYFPVDSFLYFLLYLPFWINTEKQY